MLRSLYGLYGALWPLARTLLARNQRMRHGWDERTLQKPLTRADLWLHAASVGEAGVAEELVVRMLRLAPKVRILLTVGTVQARELLGRALAQLGGTLAARVQLAYAPLDQPRLMRQAFAQVQPRVLALVETELWPAQLVEARRAGVEVVVVNGRMSERSANKYRLLSSFFAEYGPSLVMAIHEDDAERYSRCMPATRVEVAGNVKFDRLGTGAPSVGPCLKNLLAYAGQETPVCVFASVRREEERAVLTIITTLMKQAPDVLCAVFPRHAERFEPWADMLDGAGFPVERLSERCKQHCIPLVGGCVALGDVFGEVAGAYSVASAAFVGGSLAPLGGQNMLEPLAAGLVPIIGPSYENFRWAGQTLFAPRSQGGLVHVAQNAEQVAEALLQTLHDPPPREAIRAAFADHVAERSGAADLIAASLAKRLDTPASLTQESGNPA